MPRSKHPGLPKAQTGGKSVCPLCWKRPHKSDRTLNGYHISCAQEVVSMVLDAQHYQSGKLWELLYAKQQQGRG